MFGNNQISLNCFPKPYNFNFNSYSISDFHQVTYEFCQQYKNLSTIDLKVCKIIILGDLCVGKTSLLNRFCFKIFGTEYKTTIGVDFQTEDINILGIPYHLQIWDTAGQERFKCITQCYYRKAHVIMLVFDLSTISTLANCKNWLNEALETYTPSIEQQPLIFLIGNKKDLLSPEACKNVEELANITAKKLNAEFWSVSSKTGENVAQLFCRAATLAFNLDVQLFYKQLLSKNDVKIGTDLISFRQNHGGSKNTKKINRSSKCQGMNCVNNNLNKT